jgi:hypothetical protein
MAFVLSFLLMAGALTAVAQTRPVNDSTKTTSQDSGRKEEHQASITQDRLPATPIVKPTPFIHQNDRTLKFYVLASLFFLLGLFRVVFDRYVTNLFQVFFKTSLRQSQLTDQLLQARWPSFLLNLFFAVVVGFYLLLLLADTGCTGSSFFRGLAICSGIVLAVYAVKRVVTWFIGWITDQPVMAAEYIFILFLFNKMISLFLFPMIIVLAFSDGWLHALATAVTIGLVAVWIVLRYARSFGLFGSRLKISRFHFFFYVVGVEILPILIVWRWGAGHLCKFL